MVSITNIFTITSFFYFLFYWDGPLLILPIFNILFSPKKWAGPDGGQ